MRKSKLVVDSFNIRYCWNENGALLTRNAYRGIGIFRFTFHRKVLCKSHSVHKMNNIISCFNYLSCKGDRVTAYVTPIRSSRRTLEDTCNQYYTANFLKFRYILHYKGDPWEALRRMVTLETLNLSSPVPWDAKILSKISTNSWRCFEYSACNGVAALDESTRKANQLQNKKQKW